MMKRTTILLLMLSGSFMLCAQDDQGQDPLYSAVIKADISKVKEVLASGADINRQSENGYTPLMWACTYGSTPAYAEVAKLLVAEGADVNISAVEGSTALMEAANNSRELFDLLLENGADIHAKKENGTGVLTSSIFGVMMGSVSLDLVEFILSKDGDVNETIISGDAVGWTPLHFAVSNDQEPMVKLLISHGANVNAKGGDGMTPLSLAERNKNDQIIKILKAAGAK